MDASRSSPTSSTNDLNGPAVTPSVIQPGDGPKTRVLAVVALVEDLSVRARSVLEHCGFVLLRLASPQTAVARLRRDIKVEAVLLDLRAATDDRERDALLELVGYAVAAPWDARPLPVVAFTGRQAPDALTSACVKAAVPLVPPHRRNFTEIGRRLLHLCGDHARCCHERG
jgi:hypothetical protein